MSGSNIITSDGSAAYEPRAERMAPTGNWVGNLALFVLVLTITYSVFGIPGEDATDTSQTDRVSPINSYVWLTLLMLSMPVLSQRWRGVVALARGSWPLLVLFTYFGFSVLWALDPATSFRRLAFTLVQFVLIATLLTGVRRAQMVHVAIAAVCSVAAFADLAAWVIVPGTAMTDDGFGGLQGQKNQAGLLMMYGCLAAVPCILLVRRWLWRCALAGSTVMMAALLVATRSTTSQSVVISAAFVMPVLLQIGRLQRPTIWAIAATFISVLVVAFFGYLLYCGVTGTDEWGPLRNATFSARTDIWSFTVGEIEKRPLFGAGYSAFWAINPAVQPSLKADKWFGIDVIINEAHQGYLDLLATCGLFGLLLGLWVLFRGIAMAGRAIYRAQPGDVAWRDGRLARPTAIFYLALLLGLIVHNFTESNLFSNNGVLAVALLMCLLDLEKWRLTEVAQQEAIRTAGRRPLG